MMLLNKFGDRMTPYRSGYIRILAVFGLLLVAACSSTLPDRDVLNNQFPIGEAEKVFTSGFNNISDKYIDAVSVETLAMEGMRGLSALDSNVSIVRNDETIELHYRRQLIRRYHAPPPDDPARWASIVANMTADAQSFSHEIATSSAEKLYEAIFDGSIGSLDVFSRYAGKSEASDNRAKRDGFGGIGVRFRLDDDRVLITDVMLATPAARAGLRIGDELTAVDGQAVSGLGSHAIIKMLRGTVGSIVNLVIARPDINALTISMKRNHIVPPTVIAKIRDGLLYLKVSSFNQGTASSVVKELNHALDPDNHSQEIMGVALDLRGNPGGLLKQSIEVADAFLAHGTILNTSGRHPDSIQHYEAAGQDQALGLPIVVLIDGKSASAAEIVAAALQDRERAVVVGTASYGKGTVQTVVRLPNSGEITLTWSRFMAPSGYTLHGLGVFPVICTSGSDNDTDTVLRHAMETYDATLDTLETWRGTSHRDKADYKDLRSQCPPEQHDGKDDVEIARSLIEDGSLYFRALDITSATAHAVE